MSSKRIEINNITLQVSKITCLGCTALFIRVAEVYEPTRISYLVACEYAIDAGSVWQYLGGINCDWKDIANDKSELTGLASESGEDN